MIREIINVLVVTILGSCLGTLVYMGQTGQAFNLSRFIFTLVTTLIATIILRLLIALVWDI